MQEDREVWSIVKVDAFHNISNEYLLENPSFFHAYQIDISEQITNVCWCKANMILDPMYFGDVVPMDTTYYTNYVNIPLALFCGFNHYTGSIIHDVVLLSNETIDSTKWLFNPFLDVHNNKRARNFFNDQGQAMDISLAKVKFETRHGLCTWYLLKNGIKHLGNLMKE